MQYSVVFRSSQGLSHVRSVRRLCLQHQVSLNENTRPSHTSGRISIASRRHIPCRFDKCGFSFLELDKQWKHERKWYETVSCSSLKIHGQLSGGCCGGRKPTLLSESVLGYYESNGICQGSKDSCTWESGGRLAFKLFPHSLSWQALRRTSVRRERLHLQALGALFTKRN